MEWSKVVEGNVELIHNGTSSTITINITDIEPTESGGSEVIITSTCIDYEAFDNLKRAMIAIYENSFTP